jgi:hypothetical protein
MGGFFIGLLHVVCGVLLDSVLTTRNRQPAAGNN